MVRPTSPGDGTGLLRGVWISSIGGTSAIGSGTGNLLKVGYTWRGDQIVRQDACALGATGSTRKQEFAYDQQLRLINVPSPAGRGLFLQQAFDYAAPLMDAVSETQSSATAKTFTLAHNASPFGKQLSARRIAGQAYNQTNYSFDADGRVSGRWNEADSSGLASWQNAFDYRSYDGHATRDSVFKSVSVGNNRTDGTWNLMYYNYYYDAQGRRRAKVYPSGFSDEYFYDLGHNMLEDRGNNSVDSAPTEYPIDEYIWLDDRPVAMIKAKFDNNWARQTDFTGTCSRNDEAASCGLYFIATDHIKKPIAVLDSKARVAGWAEYDARGFPNRQPLNTETTHPYAASTSGYSLGQCRPYVAASTELVKTRVRMHMLDTEMQYDVVAFSDGAGQSLGSKSGYHAGERVSSWLAPSDADKLVNISFTSDAVSWCPTPDGGDLYSCPGWNYAGAVIDSCEYMRYQSGVTYPVWVPFRFPGQHYDPETDLFENWNRYYDPSIGRYLQPEPYLSNPNLVMGIRDSSFYSQRILSSKDPQAMMTSPSDVNRMGSQAAWKMLAQDPSRLSAYAYARNNPIKNTDGDGQGCMDTYTCCLERNPGNPEACGGSSAEITRRLLACEEALVACEATCACGSDPISVARNFYCKLFCGIARDACVRGVIGAN